ncbi:hypothetical protein [Planotetraspora sp. GP83]|uniref:hypothetical protein n=1 Tax=Planotetraspora sp. GP83 TaxID=3156264 RepID=UPI00351777E4
MMRSSGEVIGSTAFNLTASLTRSLAGTAPAWAVLGRVPGKVDDTEMIVIGFPKSQDESDQG